ncbi:hypothetical protein [Sutcliffiella deserti]|uniref:hypothetical protein n=1 Tax=Sutcliffiella deserti TaxID=2875501 RepID=UPI001CBE049A|nr:hypothetical protein [Sutcliffiella deserti]
MSSVRKKQPIFLCLLTAFLLLMLTACQGKEEGFQILVYADLPQESVLLGKNVLEDVDLDEEEINIQLYPGMLERLMVDIVGHTGDILIIEKEMLPAILDPVGLEPLDTVVDLKSFMDSSELKAQDENGDEHIYALPVSADLPIFNDLPIQSELVAVIPKYSSHREEALKIIEQFMDERKLVLR